MNPTTTFFAVLLAYYIVYGVMVAITILYVTYSSKHEQLGFDDDDGLIYKFIMTILVAITIAIITPLLCPVPLSGVIRIYKSTKGDGVISEANDDDNTTDTLRSTPIYTISDPNNVETQRTNSNVHVSLKDNDYVLSEKAAAQLTKETVTALRDDD